MAEPVTVVWWTADAPLFESIVHPGPQEAFVALYPHSPRPDHRATFVAVVDRAALPTECGVGMGTRERAQLTIETSLDDGVVLDVAVAAPAGTRTPSWDLVPRDRWVWIGPRNALERFIARRSPVQRTGLLILSIALMASGTYQKSLNQGRGQAEALRFAVGVFLVVGAVVLGALLWERVRANRGEGTLGARRT